MANIIIAPYWIASKLNPTFELARRLEAVGHNVTFFGKSRFHHLVTDQGFAFAEHTATKEPRATQEKQKGWSSALLKIKQRRRLAAGSSGLDNLTSCMAELSPDLILIDIELHDYIIASYPLGVPTVLLSTFICIWKLPGVPPPHRKITPGIGLKGQAIGIELAWLQYRVWKWLALQRRRLVHAGTDRVSVLRYLAREVGFPFNREVTLYQWLIPFSYRNLPVLSLNASELDFPNRHHPKFHFGGPLISKGRRETNTSENPTVDGTVRDIINRRQQGESKALVLCAFGAFFTGDDTLFWRRLARTMADFREWDVVLGLGGRVSVEALGELPHNVHAFSWLPQLRFLEHSDCAVVHGGITTINECIYFGVPMIVCPMKATDQYGSALRVEHHGLGILIDRYEENVLSIPENITKLLIDDSYRTRVRKMRDIFHSYSTDNRVVRCIENFLKEERI